MILLLYRYDVIRPQVTVKSFDAKSIYEPGIQKFFGHKKDYKKWKTERHKKFPSNVIRENDPGTDTRKITESGKLQDIKDSLTT